MKPNNSLLLAGVALVLAGCSTSTPPPRIVIIHPLPPDVRDSPRRDDVIVGKLCQLGTSCLELDPRPFEMCLLATTQRCGDKITESLLVENPASAALRPLEERLRELF
jgi:hypothetical protein